MAHRMRAVRAWCGRQTCVKMKWRISCSRPTPLALSVSQSMRPGDWAARGKVMRTPRHMKAGASKCSRWFNSGRRAQTKGGGIRGDPEGWVVLQMHCSHAMAAASQVKSRVTRQIHRTGAVQPSTFGDYLVDHDEAASATLMKRMRITLFDELKINLGLLAEAKITQPREDHSSGDDAIWRGDVHPASQGGPGNHHAACISAGR